jgi:hypothetical protein
MIVSGALINYRTTNYIDLLIARSLDLGNLLKTVQPKVYVAKKSLAFSEPHDCATKNRFTRHRPVSRRVRLSCQRHSPPTLVSGPILDRNCSYGDSV